LSAFPSRGDDRELVRLEQAQDSLSIKPAIKQHILYGKIVTRQAIQDFFKKRDLVLPLEDPEISDHLVQAVRNDRKDEVLSNGFSFLRSKTIGIVLDFLAFFLLVIRNEKDVRTDDPRPSQEQEVNEQNVIPKGFRSSKRFQLFQATG